MNYYSALYIPQEKIKPITSDPAAVSRIKDTLAAAMQKANVNQLNYNLTNLSKNMAIMATTELTQRYVAAAVSKIISGEPITSRTLLDTLFNTYAPAFNGMLEQMGYKNIYGATVEKSFLLLKEKNGAMKKDEARPAMIIGEI